MIQESHILFMRWAAWERIPIGYCGAPGWASSTITAKLMDGKGEFLPGAPRCSGPKTIPVDKDAMLVDRFLRTMPRRDKELIKLYYLQQAYTCTEKAYILNVGKKKMYAMLHYVHVRLQQFCAPNAVYRETEIV